MSTDILHPDSFIETGSCAMLRTRNQPSRETPGILLADKYITEFDKVDFNGPFRGAIQNVKELNKNFAKLDQNQKNSVASDFLVGGPFYDFISDIMIPVSETIEPVQVKHALSELASNPDTKKHMNEWFLETHKNSLIIIFMAVFALVCLAMLAGYHL